ncbi:hypothetical protein ABZ924_02130 [Streptomyces sp. NPDC046876]|uniref:hypothetical protein n=1 Tax=Streptomyces sp. NPDC046876 TaxID=3155616 RepID=UPI0033F8C127
MRRGIISAVVAGAAGVTLGLMPVSGAFAAEHTQVPQSSSTQVPQNYRWCDDWRGDWRYCCDWNYRRDRYDRCWDVDAWYDYRNDYRYDNWNRYYSNYDRGDYGHYNDYYNHYNGYDNGRYDNGHRH